MENHFNNTENEQPLDNMTEMSSISIGENIDLKGGRVIDVPDFIDLAEQGFSEDELKRIVQLRKRYNQGDHEVTPEHLRLRFARYLYDSGKIAR
jgi:hypothetical protein